MDKHIKKLDIFNGEGDVREFVTRIRLLGVMKGYTDEKLAYCLAEKLRGPAFQVFMRMSEPDIVKLVGHDAWDRNCPNYQL